MIRCITVVCLCCALGVYAQESACLSPDPYQPIELYDEGHYYAQQDTCIDLYRHPAMLEYLGGPYRRMRVEQGFSQALILAGVVMPAFWALQVVTLQMNGPNWMGLYYFNRYTVAGSLALGLSSLIPRYFAMQNLDVLVERHNARLGFKYVF